jgi:HK97 family phage prohead protease
MAARSDIERRAAVELRAAGRRLVGHAAVFDATAEIGGFREVIRRGAFKRSLAAAGDILALVDHDPANLLGRTRAGTLRLSEDERGLAFEIDMPDTTLGRDVLALAERRDLGGASFGFLVPAGGERWQGRTRELLEIDLREVSVVHAWPAYQATDVAARARGGDLAHRALARLRVEFM